MECFNDFDCCKAVEARGRLVKQYHLRISNQLYSNSRAFALTSRYLLIQYRADDRVLTLAQSQILNQCIDTLLSLLFTALKLEPGSKPERLLHGEIGEDDVVLHDIGPVLTKCLHCERILIIKCDITSDTHAWAQCNPIAHQV